jgi:hypothetical protein
LKIYKPLGTDKIPEELTQAGGNTLRPDSHKLIKLTEVNRGISLSSTTYKTLFNILLSRLTPYVDKIIGDHQCGF